MVEEVKIILQGEFKNKKAIVNALKNVDGKLKDISTGSAKATKKVSSLGVSLKKLAAIVGVAFLVRGFVNLGKSIFTAAGNMEQFTVAFTTMLGSADKARDLLEDIVEFARKTPFQIEGLVKTTKQLLAYGIAQKEIIPTLENLGNIAAGVGVPVQRLALVFGQVKSTTKLLGQDLNQFTQAGVPLLKELASTLGLTEAQVIKLKESGQISFDDVKAALRNMTAEGGRFFNLMEESSKTFLGTLSNAEDGLSVLKIAFGTALLPVGTRVLNFIIGRFDDLAVTIELNKKEIEEFSEKALRGFILLWKRGLKPILDGLGFFITGIKTLVSQPLIKWLGLAGAALLVFNGIMRIILATNPLLLAITAIITIIGFLVEKFDSFSPSIQIALLKAAKVFQNFQRDVAIILEALFDKLSLLSKVPGFGWVDDAKNKFSDFRDSVTDDIGDIEKKIQGLESIKLFEETGALPELGGNLPARTQSIITKEEGTGGVSDAEKEAAEAAIKREAERQKELEAIAAAEKVRLEIAQSTNEQLLAEQAAFLSGQAEARGEADQLELDNELLKLEQKILNEEEFAERKAELDEAFLEGKIEFQEFENELDALNNEAKLEALDRQLEAERAKDNANNAKIIEIKVKRDAAEIKVKDKKNKVELAADKIFKSKKFGNAEQLANSLVALQNSKNKTLARIGKIAAIFQITVDTAKGAISAYSSLAGIPFVGPALGAAAAGAVIAFGAEQISAATSASFAVGASEIPQDMQANIHRGEMIIPASFAESIRAGELALSGNVDTDSLANNVSESQAPTVININFDGAQFVGIDDEMVDDIANRIGERVEEDLTTAIPTRTA